MADMKIGVVGAAGRMGGAVIRQVAGTAGCAVVAASETPASPAVGRDAGDLAGIGSIGVTVADDAASLFRAADAVIEFSIPAATVAHAELAAPAGCIHIVGTTGMVLFTPVFYLVIQRIAEGGKKSPAGDPTGGV